MRFIPSWLALLASTTLLSLPAHADSYFSLDGSTVTIDPRQSGDALTQTGLRFRMGMTIAEMLDLEAQFGRTTDDSDPAYVATTTTHYGLYLKGYLPVGSYAALYALGGIGQFSHEQQIGQTMYRDNDFVYSYGLGLETSLTERIDLTADYMRWQKGDSSLVDDVSSINIGFKLYF